MIPLNGIRLIIELSEYLDVDPSLVYTKTRTKEISIVKKILMYYLVKDLKWKLKDAQTVYNTDHSTVIHAIKSAPTEMFNDHNILGIYYRAQTEFKPINIRRKFSKSKTVIQYSIKGRVIKKWDSVKEASIHFGVNVASIKDAISGKSKTSCGYKWKYETVDI